MISKDESIKTPIVELGIKALHEMKDVKKILQDVESMLHDLLSKKQYGNIKAIQTVLEALQSRAESEGKKTVVEFVRELKECLWHEGSGIDTASAVIQSTLCDAKRYDNEQSVPHTPGAMRHGYLKQVFTASFEERLAA